MKKILCICFSPTLQKTISFENLQLTKVNRSKKYIVDASGKALNSARILNQLENGCVKTICPLGKENASFFAELAEKDNLNLSYVELPGFTRECCTLLDRINNTTTELVISEPAENLGLPENFKAPEKELLDLIKKTIVEVDGVLLSGSRPAIWSNKIYPEICKYAEENKKIILADFIGEDLLNSIKETVPTIIKINDEEFCKTFDLNYPLSEDELKNQICKKSLELSNIIIITRGEKSTFGSCKGSLIEVQSEKLIPVNTTACGDSFNSGFIYEYLNTGNLNSAMKKGTWCAACNAKKERPGTIY